MDSAKAALRRVMKARIAALDAAYDKAAGEGIVRRLTAHPAWAAADSVFCYVGRRGEIDTRPLLRAALEAGKTLAVPLCMGPGMMQARAVRSLEELAPAGPYGIPEPPAGAPEVPPQRLALCVLPCLAAAPDGTRLGYGGGYYDRYLEYYQGPAILVCPDRLLQPRVPVGLHDRRVRIVATETQIWRTGAAL
mgnify:CR=1 FL=1